MKTPLVALLLATSISEGVSYTQTDWSGGPGVTGPVTDWGSSFDQATRLCWSVGGRLTIDTNFVDQGYITGTPAISGYGPVTAICAVDFTGDGVPDIAGGFWNPGSVSLAVNSGYGSSWQTVLVDAQAEEPVMLAAADFDGDGDADMALSEAGTGSIVWYANSGAGTSWVEHTVGSCPEAYSCVAWNPDADADIDILCTSRTADGWVGWFENESGTGSVWSAHVIDDQFEMPAFAATGDMNGDGVPDVAVAGEGDPRLAVYLSPGYSRTELASPALGRTLLGLVLADLDGDGKDDIAGGSLISPGIVCFIDPASPSGPTLVEASAEQASSCLFARDLDQDGDLDLVSSSFSEDFLLRLENTSSGLAWAQMPNTGVGASGFFSISQGDFDGDGNTDLAGSSYMGQALLTMLWGDVCVFYPFGSLASSILQMDNSTGNPWFVYVDADAPVNMRFRASDDPGEMGLWSAEMPVDPGQWEHPAGVVEPGDLYVQYWVGLDSLGYSGTPVLESVSISNSPTGIEGDPPVLEPSVQPRANPSRGGIEVILGQPSGGAATVLIFDMSGRMVEEVFSGLLPAGEHALRSRDLPVGCYTVRFDADGAARTCRVVVLE